MNAQDAAKRQAAEAALKYVEPGEVLGVGTGSTVNHFIDLLVERGLARDVAGAVSSSNASTERLKKARINVVDLNQAGTMSVYVDGADEATRGAVIGDLTLRLAPYLGADGLRLPARLHLVTAGAPA